MTVAAFLSVALVALALVLPLIALVLGWDVDAALMAMFVMLFGVALALPVIWLFVFVVYVLRRAARTFGGSQP